QGSTKLMASKWSFTLFAPQEAQGESLLMWIMNTWDYSGTGRLPRVAMIGASLTSTEYYIKGLDAFVAANPGKFDWVTTQRVPVSQTAWAAETSKILSCDYVVINMIGPSVPSFVKETRDRGYKGKLLSGMEAFAGFWNLVIPSVPAASLYDCYFTHMLPWWSEAGEFVDTMKQYMTSHRTQSEAQSIVLGGGYATGWATAMFTLDSVKRAFEATAAGAVPDGQTLSNAFIALDMTVPQWGNAWQVTANNSCLARESRIFKYDQAKGDWFPITDWALAPTAAIS
ncbi:MAG: ABC transporter substrate-binding protein, partial [Chloroflexi bacterium]|nr:ABC transporter substrate-binding protein [Chloroflexota bacterium]